MRVAVVGGTGLVGRHVVDVLTANGHEPVVVARSTGVDVLSGEGLDRALEGAAATVDVTNTTVLDASETVAFFGGVSSRLVAAGQRAGVRHHVLLSIVGIDRAPSNPHYAGKLRQEQAVLDGGLPFTILRATQFHEFAEMVVGWTRQGDTAVVAPLLVQPVAAADVAATLAELAVGEPLNVTVELAGPDRHDLVDMARRTLAARGDDVRLVPSWSDGPFDVTLAGEVLLPGSDARIGPTSFDAWLASKSASA